jgi:hypothetical protein
MLSDREGQAIEIASLPHTSFRAGRKLAIAKTEWGRFVKMGNGIVYEYRKFIRLSDLSYY